METRKRGKAIIGIALAAIVVASVMAAMIGGAGAINTTGGDAGHYTFQVKTVEE